MRLAKRGLREDHRTLGGGGVGLGAEALRASRTTPAVFLAALRRGRAGAADAAERAAAGRARVARGTEGARHTGRAGVGIAAQLGGRDDLAASVSKARSTPRSTASEVEHSKPAPDLYLTGGGRAGRSSRGVPGGRGHTRGDRVGEGGRDVRGAGAGVSSTALPPLPQADLVIDDYSQFDLSLLDGAAG